MAVGRSDRTHTQYVSVRHVLIWAVLILKHPVTFWALNGVLGYSKSLSILPFPSLSRSCLFLLCIQSLAVEPPFLFAVRPLNRRAVFAVQLAVEPPLLVAVCVFNRRTVDPVHLVVEIPFLVAV